MMRVGGHKLNLANMTFLKLRLLMVSSTCYVGTTDQRLEAIRKLRRWGYEPTGKEGRGKWINE